MDTSGSATPRAASVVLSQRRVPQTRSFASSSIARQSDRGGREDGGDCVPLTGDPDTDGMNIYQIDFLETAAWTKDLLLKMKHHEQLLKGLRQEQPPQDPLAFFTYKTHSIYDFDFTNPDPDPINKTVEVSFHVGKLLAHYGMNAKKRHKLVLLCAESYNPDTDTVTLSCDKFDERVYNKIYLSDTILRLIREVNERRDYLIDVPLDLRYTADPIKSPDRAAVKQAAAAGRQRKQPQRWQSPAFWALNAKKKREAASQEALELDL